MSTAKNKAVVRRFVKEVLTKGKTEVIDELLAPNYANTLMGVTNREAFKGAVSGLDAAFRSREFKIDQLVAEGNCVVLRATMNATLASGKKVSSRVMTYYCLAKGKIVVDDPMSDPPMSQFLGGMMPPQSSS